MRVRGKEVVSYISSLYGKKYKEFFNFFNKLDNCKKAEILQSFIVDYLTEKSQRFQYFDENELSINEKIIEVVARTEYKILLEYVFSTTKSHDISFVIDTSFRYIHTNYNAVSQGKRRDAKAWLLKLVSELYEIEIELTNVSKRYIKLQGSEQSIKYTSDLDYIDYEYTIFKQPKQQKNKQKNKQKQEKQKKQEKQYQLCFFNTSEG